MKNNILTEIEKEFNIFTIYEKNSNIHIWPLLRQKIYFTYLKNDLGYSDKKRTRDVIQLLKNAFYGFSQIWHLKKFDYLFFQNTNKRLYIDNTFFDVYFDAWADKLSRNKSLFIEFAHKQHYAKNKVHSKNIISDLPFKFIIWLFRLFVKIDAEGLDVVQRITSQYKINFNYNREIKSQIAEYKFYVFLFRLIKPKMIFILSSFTKVGVVFAAKMCGIKVYEAQHGFIGESHPFYTIHQKFNDYYPDGLISFGNYEVKNNENLMFSKENIYPVGGYQLEYLKNLPTPKPLLSMKAKFNRIFCICLQGIKEDKLLDMVINFARNHSSDLFYICPKNINSCYDDYLQLDNVKLSNYTIYDIFKISDFNITIFSTTAVECQVFGVNTILFNIGKLSEKYFNLEKIKAIVIEENENLNESHLLTKNEHKEGYYFNNYLDNVTKTSLPA